jgi:hypothetical protein
LLDPHVRQDQLAFFGTQFGRAGQSGLGTGDRRTQHDDSRGTSER